MMARECFFYGIGISKIILFLVIKLLHISHSILIKSKFLVK